ncbi:hypothetical protein PAXRUDRAFT_831538 [Paxillus rubicundulus Ve08.2h10]|uniref:Uncharacterized protein n=1 Tax=Paxillus rubicundulus Ve08.2h10 TaxID=930991 RepID=A0A0D0DRU8_9AGAM|nr:hypothetical protein PAXRUDRAFT_831538 [Paxillus rubicundulus Ve08.2h10]
MDLSPQSRPDVSKTDPPPQMWILCVESRPNESKTAPPFQSCPERPTGARNP